VKEGVGAKRSQRHCDVPCELRSPVVPRLVFEMDNRPLLSSSAIPQELIMVELNIVVNFSQLMCCKNEKMNE